MRRLRPTTAARPRNGYTEMTEETFRGIVMILMILGILYLLKSVGRK